MRRIAAAGSTAKTSVTAGGQVGQVVAGPEPDDEQPPGRAAQRLGTPAPDGGDLAGPGQPVVEPGEDRMVMRVGLHGRASQDSSAAMRRPSARPESQAVSTRGEPQPSPARPMRSAPKK